MMMLRFTVLFLCASPQGLPGLVIVDVLLAGLTLLDGLRPATGATGLRPAPPISVAPRGIPTGPIDEGEGSGDEILRLSAQESDALPEIPPPSNVVRDDRAPSEPSQDSIGAPCAGAIGLMPGVAISVEPSGMPADRMASGDVVRMPTIGCVSVNVAWAIAAVGALHALPAINEAHRMANAILRDLELCALRRFEACCFRICGAPAGFLSSDNREQEKHRYSENARPALWLHDERNYSERGW
jgi:hypothetical protein